MNTFISSLARAQSARHAKPIESARKSQIELARIAFIVIKSKLKFVFGFFSHSLLFILSARHQTQSQQACRRCPVSAFCGWSICLCYVRVRTYRAFDVRVAFARTFWTRILNYELFRRLNNLNLFHVQSHVRRVEFHSRSKCQLPHKLRRRANKIQIEPKTKNRTCFRWISSLSLTIYTIWM